VFFEKLTLPRRAAVTYWPAVLLAAKTDGSVFYDKLTPSIAERKCRFDSLHTLISLSDKDVFNFYGQIIAWS
jgi:hypothetical protein